MARKSRASWRVMFATLRICRSPQKQLVVVKGRHLVQMNRVDRHHSTFAQCRQGMDDDLSTGSEGDRTIELSRWHFVLFAHPGSPKSSRHPAMALAPGRDINLALP